MEEKIYKQFLSDDGKNLISVNEIISNVKDLEISTIMISSPGYYRTDNRMVKILYTDFDHPLTLEDKIFGNGKILYIDPDWYIKNQQYVDELICYIANNTPTTNFSISSGSLIHDRLIDSMCNNPSLINIILGSDDDQYTLTQKDYLKFKSSIIEKVNSTGVDSSLENNFEKLVGYNSDRFLIKQFRYEALNPNEEEPIYINESLNDEELENIKYINNNIVFQLTAAAIFDVVKISNRLKQLNKHNRIILNIENKNNFNKFISKNTFQDDNIFIGSYRSSLIRLQDYINFEKMLYEMIEPAKDLSPFEKYIYAYNITKQFKKYKENDEDKHKSRNLYDILINEYMVCVGYANMFGDLLDKLGISNMELHVDVDVSLDKVDINDLNPNVDEVDMRGHARRYAYIKDEKYNIDGFYITDPTWDNDLEFDYYNYLAITDHESTMSNRYILLNKYTADEIFNINTIEEFYSKINFFLKKDSIESVIYKILSKIQKLDINYYNSLKSNEKFSPFIEEEKLENLNELLYELGDYLLRRVNKSISGDTIMRAVEVIYRKSYGYNEVDLDRKLNRVRELNMIRQEEQFPKRKIVYSDNREEIFNNTTNKFEIKEENKIFN